MAPSALWEEGVVDSQNLQCVPSAVSGFSTPTAVSGNLDFRPSARASHSPAHHRRRRGAVLGDNSNGQLGDGSGINRTQPVAVAAPDVRR